MKKRVHIALGLLLVLSLTVLAKTNTINLEKYSISKISSFPKEYASALQERQKSEPIIEGETNWVYKFNAQRSLEGKITGRSKEDEMGDSFIISTLYLNLNGKKIVVDKDAYNYSPISWSPDGNNFVYYRIGNPPADWQMGDVYLVTIDSKNNKIDRKLIVSCISGSQFTWAKKNNYVAFADFEAIYILDTNTGKTRIIRGAWAKESGSYEKGTGYPRLCGAFVWLNDDKELYFSYKPDLNFPEEIDKYVIKFGK